MRRANEILKSASAFFAAALDPPRRFLVDFIDQHRKVFGVEPICTVFTQHGIKIAPQHLLRRQVTEALEAGSA